MRSHSWFDGGHRRRPYNVVLGKVGFWAKIWDWGFSSFWDALLGRGLCPSPLCVTPLVRGVPKKKRGKYEPDRPNGLGDMVRDRWPVETGGGGERVSASRGKIFEANNSGFRKQFVTPLYLELHALQT